MRAKFLKFGFEYFEPHEIMELLTYYSIPRRDTNALGHKIINHFGSISAVFDAPFHEVEKVAGKSTATLFKIIKDLRRIELIDRDNNSDTRDFRTRISEMLESRFDGLTVEHMYAILLDNASNIVSCEKISEGMSDFTRLEIRKLYDLTLKYNVVNVILAHNHPMGSPKFSQTDINSTKNAQSMLLNMGVRVVDHFIYARGANYSMRELGILEAPEVW
ncbi:MAG: hypothetical protein FWH14_00115 [Oscillospiraceae bacterium]|nr:hypothetical protein [Oscillospiraceae bacterium]